MLKKLIVLTLCATTLNTYAETCPTPKEIKSNHFREWTPRNIDSAELISIEELKKFQKSVRTFAGAAWMPDAPEGTAHCYYEDVDVYLTKYNLMPDTESSHWHLTSLDNQGCETSIETCRFKLKN